MKCSICKKSINEGDYITRYALGSSPSRYWAHEECVARITLKDVDELWHGQYLKSD